MVRVPRHRKSTIGARCRGAPCDTVVGSNSRTLKKGPPPPPRQTGPGIDCCTTKSGRPAASRGVRVAHVRTGRELRERTHGVGAGVVSAAGARSTNRCQIPARRETASVPGDP